VFGTLAYLQSTDEVVNTFTVGKVVITLDEAPVDAEGNATTAARVKANAYKLMPGHEYDKDPTVHVDPTSQDCYVFVKVENGIAGIESKAADYKSIADQITNVYGWTALEGKNNVFYKTWKQGETADLQVFAEFQIDGAVTNQQIEAYSFSKITINAYAVQQDTFANAKAAWDAAGFDQQ
jgi:hypothetical protein